MKADTLLKLGQVTGALIMAAGVAACVNREHIGASPTLLLIGAALYGGCRLTAWFRTPPK